MKRLAGVLFLAALLALRGTALAAASSPADWAFSDLRTLLADGVIDGYPADALANKTSLSRTEMALLTARAVAKVEASGASAADEARVQALSNEFRSELQTLGVRENDLSKLRAALDARTVRAQHLALAGELIAGSSGVEPSLTIAVPDSSSVTHFSARVGALLNVPDSIAGLALNSHAPLQPLENGVAISGTLGGVSDFYFSVARIQGDVLYASPMNVTAGRSFTAASFAVTPQEGGFIQFGPQDSLTGRLVQHLRLSPGATIGVTYSHLFDAAPHSLAANFVSKTIFGMDLALPVFARSGWHPSVYAEAASSSANRSGDSGPLPMLFTSQTEIDRALVAGITFRVRSITGNIQYQSVGPNFAAGVQPMPGFFGLSLINPQMAAANFAGQAETQAGPVFTPFDDASSLSSSSFVPNSQGIKVDIATPVRLGNYTVQGNFSAAHLQELAADAYTVTPAVRGTDDRLSAGASFDLRALGRPVNLDLSASVEQLKRNNPTALTYLSYDANAQGPDPGQFATAPLGVNPVTFNPNFVNVTRRSLNAAAAMPLSRDLSLNLQYNAQYYSGSYSSLGQNIDGRKDFYLGNLTYTIPRTSSAITFSAKQYRYRDAFVPSYNLTQNRADLNFTVKF
jgi:hypothetical protein